MQLKKLLLPTAAVVNCMSPAQAQEGARAGLLEEVMVTAQKRTENVQDVPVAMSVVTADALVSAGGTQFSDLPKLTPGLTITEGDQPGNNSISMRGIGTFAFSIGVEPSVLTVVDDVAVGLQAQSFGDLADVERVEVLRGPQSTLFGKAASAGVISVTTKAPSDEFTANADVLITDDHEQRYAAGISGPLGGAVSYRLSGMYSSYDGNVREATSGRMLNARDDKSGRLKILFEPSDGFDATLIAHYAEGESSCCEDVPVIVASNANLLNNPAFSPTLWLRGVTPGRDNRKTVRDVVPTSDSENKGASLKVNLDIGDHTLTSVTALHEYRLLDRRDFDETAENALGIATGGAQSGSLDQFGSFDTQTFSQELRLSSAPQTLEYLVGAYYADNDFARRFQRLGPISRGNWLGETTSEAYAVFGQGVWKVTPSTHLVLGLRYNEEEISYRYESFPYPGYRAPFIDSDSAKEDVVTGKLGVQQYVGDDIMLFATYSRGHKGQAYDLTSSFTPSAADLTQPIEAEQSDNYELGMKGTFIGGNAILNVTAFRTDYSNFQSQTLEPSLGGAFFLANVGELRTQGVETEWLVRPVDAVKLSGSIAYIDAKIESYPRGQCYAGQTAAQGGVSGFQNLSGERLNNAPEWKASVAADVDFPLGDLPVIGLFNLSYSSQSEINYALTQDPSLVQPDYGIANATLGIKELDLARYTVSVFVRNIFNKHYFSTMTNNSNLFGNQLMIQGNLPRDFERLFGLRLSVNF